MGPKKKKKKKKKDSARKIRKLHPVSQCSVVVEGPFTVEKLFNSRVMSS